MAYLPSTPEPSTTSKPESIVLRSSFLQSATYDPTNYALTLDFKSGHSIMHRFFFPVTWQQFKESPNHGSYYACMIKGKPQYPAISLRTPLKVSDIKKAHKKYRPEVK